MTVQVLIDIMRELIGDTLKPYRFTDYVLLSMLDDEYKIEIGLNKLLQYKDTIIGDGTGRYSLDSNLTYLPIEIKRVFLNTDELGRMRRLQSDVLVGSEEIAG